MHCFGILKNCVCVIQEFASWQLSLAVLIFLHILFHLEQWATKPPHRTVVNNSVDQITEAFLGRKRNDHSKTPKGSESQQSCLKVMTGAMHALGRNLETMKRIGVGGGEGCYSMLAES